MHVPSTKSFLTVRGVGYHYIAQSS